MEKLCECGCGELAPLAKKTSKRFGHVKDKPIRFILGHNRRVQRIKKQYKESKSGCWEWIMFKDRDGYGMISINQNMTRAHRYYYEISNGKIPNGLVVDHLCRNTSCVNPAHMEIVSVAVNSQRKKNAKLDPTKILDIRKRWNKGERQIDLAKEYDVNPNHIYKIVSRRQWANV